MKRVGVVAVWVLAAVGTTSITLAAVSQVGGQVTERAAGPIDSADLAAARAAAMAQAPTATQEAPAPQTIGDTTTTTVPRVDISPTSTAPQAMSATPTTSLPAVEQVTTTAPIATTEPPPVTLPSEQVTTTLTGGTVTVNRSGSTVTLVSAVPNSGFWTELEESGPGQVVLEFESSSHGSDYEATVANGKLDIRTEEHQEDGD